MEDEHEQLHQPGARGPRQYQLSDEQGWVAHEIGPPPQHAQQPHPPPGFPPPFAQMGYSHQTGYPQQHPPPWAPPPRRGPWFRVVLLAVNAAVLAWFLVVLLRLVDAGSCGTLTAAECRQIRGFGIVVVVLVFLVVAGVVNAVLLLARAIARRAAR